MNAAHQTRSPQRSAQIHAGSPCDLRCAVCDCSAQRSDEVEIERTLAGGGARLVIRGGSALDATVGSLVARARQQGFAEIVVRSNAIAARNPQLATQFARFGADSVLVPLFSHDPKLHDHVAARPKALIDALAGMRALARAGVGLEIEVPLLPLSLQNPSAVVRLAHRAVPTLRRARFFVPPFAPGALATSSWSSAGPALAAAVKLCRELGIHVRLGSDDGVPLCALRAEPELYDVYAFNPAARSSLRTHAILADVCRACAVRPQCPGLLPSYTQVHGARGVVPYSRRPPLMYEQRTTRRRGWTEAQGRAAARAEILVLRPTVNCNQDCTFCSANETSANVWANHDEMLRAIARAARRGVERLSFSGGEPTLSKHLGEYIHCARRLGIPQIEIVSNGVLLDRQEKVAALVSAGLTEAFISLHGHDEAISQQATQKLGDFERTLSAIGHLLDSGVRTAINHVITSRNYAYLGQFVELVHRRFGGRTKISFAFVTPQFKALENLELMPSLSAVMPHLKRALYRALELGQPFSIGSRQGIPFCFLDEFRAWSDGIKRASSAIAEDSFQKERGPECDRCRYSACCTGLWRPYAAKFGFDELRPIAGAPITDIEVDAFKEMSRLYPWGVAPSFEQVPEGLRERTLELGPPQIAPAAANRPTFELHRSRPLRFALAGSGRQARRIARAASAVGGISLDAIASPHVAQADAPELGDCPRYDDVAAMLDDIRPEALIVAAATEVHGELASLAIERGIPVLLEKPPAASIDDALKLLARARAAGAMVVPAHNALHPTGLERLWAEPFDDRCISLVWRRTAASSDSLRAWNRAALIQLFYHLLAITGRIAGDGEADVRRAAVQGDSAPAAIRVELSYARATAEIALDFAAGGEEDLVAVRRSQPGGEVISWRRQGRAITLSDLSGSHPVESEGSDLERLLASFRDTVLGKRPPAATLDEAIDVMRNCRAVVDALAAAGAPFERAAAPKHVASKGLLRAEFT